MVSFPLGELFGVRTVAFAASFGNHDAVDTPGLFYHLVQDAVLTTESIAPLLAILPPERFVSTHLRDGEAFDSTRWPVANNAALASIAARCFEDPALDKALQDIGRAHGDRLSLRALARTATAQSLAAIGGDADLLLMLWPDATPADLALFSKPRIGEEIASMVEALCHTHYQAADGLYAYHVARGYPGPSAEAAARIVKRALEMGKLHRDELIAAAVALVRQPAA